MKLINSLLVGLLIVNCATATAQEAEKVESSEIKTVQVERAVRRPATIQTPEQIAKKQTENMTALLVLSEEQVERVHHVNLMVANKIDVIRKSDMTPERKKEFIEGNRKDRMSILSTVLTPEQHAKYVEHVNTQKEAHEESLNTAE